MDPKSHCVDAGLLRHQLWEWNRHSLRSGMPDALTSAIEFDPPASTDPEGHGRQPEEHDPRGRSVGDGPPGRGDLFAASGIIAGPSSSARRNTAAGPSPGAAAPIPATPPYERQAVRILHRRAIRSGPRPALNDRVLRHVSDRTARRVPSRPASRTPRTPSPGDEDRLRLHGLGPPRRGKMVVGLAELGSLWCE